MNQQNTPLRVIVGNPPYSVGQSSANDNAQNESYPLLESRLASTYVAGTNATNKNALYDSYIKAFRWASDRLEKDHGGVIGFVSNAGWLDGAAMDGMRACLQDEFDSIYVFNLRGNQRTQGETSRREGGKIFGSGSRTPVAITILVKNPKASKEKADIFYVDIGDYLSREDKLAIIADYKSCMSRKFSDAVKVLKPNEYNDWLNQRNSVFEDFVPIGDKKDKTSKAKVFCDFYGRGIATARDTWIYNFSQPAVKQNMQVTIDFYNEELDHLLLDESYEPIRDSHKITWVRSTLQCLHRHMRLEYDDSLLTEAMYRPFCKQHLLNYSPLIDMTYQMPKIFPTGSEENLLICASGISGTKEMSVLIADKIPDLHFNGDTQAFPLYYYEEKETIQGNLFDQGQDKYIRRDGITDFIYQQAVALYGDRVTKEDIFFYVYGFLHLPKYRTEFAADLKKSLPRIMLVKTPKVFWQLSKAGRALADIHLHYEDQPPTEGVVVEGAESGNFAVTKLKFKSKDDKSTLIYNKYITIKNIPDAAHTYIVNGRSPLEWIIDRYQVKTDSKSGILNDCNKWGEEHGNPRYILDLILSCITVAIKTQEIVNSLPDVDFEG